MEIYKMAAEMTDKELMPHKQPLKPEDILWLEKFIKDQCNGVKQWTMCVPVQDDDSDMVLCRILNHLKSDTRHTPAPVDVDELRHHMKLKVKLHCLARNVDNTDKMVDLVIDYLKSSGHLHPPAPVTQEAARMALDDLKDWMITKPMTSGFTHRSLKSETVKVCLDILQHHAGKGEGE
jgi:hypothetical protein